MIRYKTLYLLFSLFVFVQTNPPAFAQDTSFPIDEWVKKLNAKKDSNNENFWTINETLYHSNSTVASGALIELEKSLASGNLFFKSKISLSQSHRAIHI